MGMGPPALALVCVHAHQDQLSSIAVGERTLALIKGGIAIVLACRCITQTEIPAIQVGL